MKSLRILPVLAGCVLFAGCKYRAPDDVTVVLPDGTRIYQMDDQPPLRYQRDFVPVYSTAGQQGGTRQGGNTAGASAGAVGSVPPGSVIPGQWKAYAHGRYTDPLDPTVVHERSVAYRREVPPGFDMQPENGQIIIGPVLGKTPAAFRPVVVEQEMLHEKAKYAEAAQAMLDSQAGQIAATERLNKRSEEMQRILERQGDALEKADAEKAKKDAEIAELKKRLAEANKPTDYKGDSN